ncbi:unnamed protein product [[Candida] boidinii]|uniref:Translation initiation factor IF-2, mitochondrial n=1 Tax=Candida boidinii TaxID=5477 RepID=A0A9W6T2T3_CANBO|nr:hypothetical protein B5S30_g5378 [[Candida] boidinii]GME72667.1 unnamed protein product [[Candida] boidinii]
MLTRLARSNSTLIFKSLVESASQVSRSGRPLNYTTIHKRLISSSLITQNEVKNRKPRQNNRSNNNYKNNKNNNRKNNNNSNINNNKKNADQDEDANLMRELELEEQQAAEREKQRMISNNISKKSKLDIPSYISVANFSTILRVKVSELLKRMKSLGFENMSGDYILDGETAGLIAEEYGFEVVANDDTGLDLFPSTPDPKKLKPRSPVVTIMGHVDHGKTTILDFLRKSSIVKGEHGGITQHIGAFSVTTPVSKKLITFLDTPGHAAFLKMRARGASMTDVVILVVAADDSVMPQTIEAIKHSKAAGVPVIVAINKCDKEDANPEKVIADLAQQGVDVEDYGGDVPTVKVSGKTGLGMQDLEETIVTVADLQELQAEPNNVAVEGWIIESQVKKGLGSVATFLVKKGTVTPGMILVAGTTWCKVKLMRDEFGKPVKKAGPSTPVELSGWKEVPEAGELTIQAKNENIAKNVINNREKRARQIEEASQIEDMNKRRLSIIEESEREAKLQEYKLAGLSLEEIKEMEPSLFNEDADKTKEVNYVIKADVSGSAEAVSQSIEGLGNDEVQSHVLYNEVGTPTETDIERAKAAGAVILAFNIKVPKDIMNSASRAGVEVKEFNIIYHLIEDVLKNLTAQLPVKYEIKVKSTVEIRQLFEISGKEGAKIVVAGSRVTNGTIKRNSLIRVMRDGEEIHRGKIKQIKVFKDVVSEVKNGGDCGIILEGDPKIKEGDVIEAIEEVPIKRHL